MAVDWEEAFLYLLERTGNVQLSAERAGVTRQAVYKRRRVDPGFAERWRSTRGRRRQQRLERVRRSW